MKQNKTKICHRNPCGHQTWLLTEKGCQPLVRLFILHVIIEMIWFKSIILLFVLFVPSGPLFYFQCPCITLVCLWLCLISFVCLLALILCYFSDCFSPSSMHLSFTTVCLQMIFYLFRDKNLKWVYFSIVSPNFSCYYCLLYVFSMHMYIVLNFT